MYKLTWNTIILSFFVYVFYILFMPTMGDSGDIQSWADWAAYISEHGFKNAYGSGSNYLPGHLYELKLYSLFFKSRDLINENIVCLKYFSFLFDLAGAMMVGSLVKESSKQSLVLLVLILNPGYIHNTIFWGQFDSVFSTLCFASFLALYNKRFLMASILYVISLNFKLQAIIFLPAILLFMIYQSELKIRWAPLMKGILIIISIETIILLPFLLHSGGTEILETLTGLGGVSGWISLNAGNIWHWLIDGGDLRWMTDKIEFWGMPLKRWGLLMTGAGFLITLFPFGKAIVNKFQNRSYNLSLLQLSIMFGLSVLVFFFFNTQMHERYSFPAFLFIATVALLTEKWWLYGFFSIGYFLNNEMCLKSFKEYDYHSWIFDLRVSSALFMLTIVILLYYLYEPTYLKKQKPIENS
jgi:Gpi18-like mannosyltransferase